VIWVHLTLIALAALVAYCLLALVKPTRKCGRCKGAPRRSKRWLGLFGPMGKCRRCKGKRRHPRRGAQLVHRFAWLVISDIRERRHERLKGQDT
jgi:hypothetical protein